MESQTLYSGVDFDEKDRTLVNEDAKTREQYKRILLGFSIAMLIFSMAAFAVVLAVILNMETAESDASDLSREFAADIEATCAGYDVRGIAVGSSSANETALFVDNTFQQLRLVLPSGSARTGRAAYVSRNDELWIPNTASSTIYVYETITWRIKRALSSPPCDAPDYGDYHPLAGADKGGQVWFACTNSDAFIAYDASSYERVAFIKIASDLRSVYDAYDLRVGEHFVMTSLRNTTGSWSGVIVQYSTETFLPVASYAGVGAHVLLWYNQKPTSRLYGSSAFTDDIYKIDFNAFIPLDAINMTNPGALTTDPYDRFLYVAKADTDGSDAVHGYDTERLQALSESPYAAPINGTFFVLSAAVTNRLFVTSPNGTAPNVLLSYTYAEDTGNLEFDEELTTVADAAQMTRAANGCPCRLCPDWMS